MLNVEFSVISDSIMMVYLSFHYIHHYAAYMRAYIAHMLYNLFYYSSFFRMITDRVSETTTLKLFF